MKRSRRRFLGTLSVVLGRGEEEGEGTYTTPTVWSIVTKILSYVGRTVLGAVTSVA